MTATVYLFARRVHAVGAAVPSGVAPPSTGDAVAVTHPTRPHARVGDGPVRRPACVSPTARPVAPTTSPAAGAVVVGALFGPAGSTYSTSGRPGHHGGAA